MAIFSALDWPIRLLLAAVVTAAVGTGVFFLVRTSGDGSQPSAVVGTMTLEASPTSDQLTPTPQPPATEEATQPAATEIPATATPTPYPTLPPPPPKPDSPTPVEGTALAGGQWYRLDSCIDFYLPAGWTFILQRGVADPGGGFIGFSEESSGEAIFFRREGLAEWSRTASPSLSPAFDQIASTKSRVC